MKFRIFFLTILSIWSSSSIASECVILLHGLARTEHSFSKMQNTLTDSGYVVINNSYPSTKFEIKTLAENAIPTAISECPEYSTIHFVTHSMGGILIRYFLNEHSIEQLGSVVMLGPPNKGSELTDILKDTPGYSLINGPAGSELGTDSLSTPNILGPVDFEVGIIAGNETFNPILSTMLPNPDDGKVSVENTKIEGMTDHIEMEVTHTFMMKNEDVIQQVLHFLKEGSFKRDS